MNESLVRVIYVSRNIIQGDDGQVSGEIADLLERSRILNVQSGITGALMFNRGLFAQVLEGTSEEVEDTFERIQCDSRHANVSLVACEPISERSFARWSMGYIGPQAEVPVGLLDIAGENGFDLARFDGDTVHEALKRLLQEPDQANVAG